MAQASACATQIRTIFDLFYKTNFNQSPAMAQASACATQTRIIINLFYKTNFNQSPAMAQGPLVPRRLELSLTYSIKLISIDPFSPP